MKKNNRNTEFRSFLKSKNILLSDNWRVKINFKKPDNGKKCIKTFEQVFDNYCNLHLPTLSESSRVMKLRRCNKFIKPLESICMQGFLKEILYENKGS